MNALTGPYLHARVPASCRATLLSLRAVAANLSVAAGALVLGGLVDAAGTATAFAFAGGLTAASALPLLGVAAVLRRDSGGAGASRGTDRDERGSVRA